MEIFWSFWTAGQDNNKMLYLTKSRMWRDFGVNVLEFQKARRQSPNHSTYFGIDNIKEWLKQCTTTWQLIGWASIFMYATTYWSSILSCTTNSAKISSKEWDYMHGGFVIHISWGISKRQTDPITIAECLFKCTLQECSFYSMRLLFRSIMLFTFFWSQSSSFMSVIHYMLFHVTMSCVYYFTILFRSFTYYVWLYNNIDVHYYYYLFTIY